MNVINTEIETNKGKLFIGFSDVKAKLATVEAQANELVVSTEAKKESIRQEVQAILDQLKTLAADNAGLFEKAPKGKEGKAAIEAIKSELAVIATSETEIPLLLESGKLLNAQSKATAALDKASAINEELKGVVEKYNQRNR